jgi:hypothetical protein
MSFEYDTFLVNVVFNFESHCNWGLDMWTNDMLSSENTNEPCDVPTTR